MTRATALRHRLLVGAVFTSLAIPMAARAQEAAPAADAATPAADQSSSQPRVDDIVVTAERRESSLQRTPISIVAVSSERLSQTAAPDIQALANFIPNLSIGSSALGPTMPGFSIRGIGQSSTRVHQEAGVALYVDDVYYPRTIGSLFNVVDMERIEVLRGPQGTLFGRNAVGGAIRYVTKKPTQAYESRFSVTAGSYGRVDVEGMANLPLMPGVALRVQAAKLTDDGYIDEYRWDRSSNTLRKSPDRTGSKDDTLWRAAFRLQPDSDLTIDLSAQHMHAGGTPPPSLIRSIEPTTGAAALSQRAFRPIQVYLTNGLHVPALGVNDPLIVAPGYYADTDRCITDDPSLPVTSNRDVYDLSRSCDTSVDTTVKIYEGVIGWDLTSQFALKSITGYQTLDSDSTIDLWGLDQPAGQMEQGKTFSQELQLQYSGTSLKFTLGAFYFRQRAKEQTYQRRIGTPFSPASPNIVEIQGEDTYFNQLARSWALYGEATYNITPKLFLTGGLRYTDDRKTAAISATNVSNNQVFENRQHFTSTDYRVVLRYQFDSNISAYASTSSGYKAGGFNNRLVAFKPFNPPPAAPIPNPQPVVQYSPEEITSYEVGLRSDLFDKRLRLNLTGYYMPYRNIIQDYVDFSGTAGAQVFSVNAADAHIKGVEGDLSFAATRELTLNGSFAMNRVKFTRLIVGSPALDPLSCPGVNPPTPTACEPMQYARSPKLSFTLGAAYVKPLSASTDMTLTANYGYVGRQQSQYSAASSIWLPAYGVLNVRAQFDFGDHISLAGFVTNALAAKYASGGGFGADNNGNVTIQVPGRPREFGLTGTLKF